MTKARTEVKCDSEIKAQLLMQRIPFTEAFHVGAKLLLNGNLTERGGIMNEMEQVKKDINVLNNKYKFLEKQLKELGSKKSKEETDERKKRVEMAERINQGIKMNNPARDL